MVLPTSLVQSESDNASAKNLSPRPNLEWLNKKQHVSASLKIHNQSQESLKPVKRQSDINPKNNSPTQSNIKIEEEYYHDSEFE